MSDNLKIVVLLCLTPLNTFKNDKDILEKIQNLQLKIKIVSR